MRSSRRLSGEISENLGAGTMPKGKHMSNNGSDNQLHNSSVLENVEVEGPNLRHRVHLNPTRCFTIYGACKLRPYISTVTTPEISMDVYINKFGKMRIDRTHSSIWSNATQLENPTPCKSN